MGDVADGMTNRHLREIFFDDVTSFVEAKARVLNHPIFGNLRNDLRNKSKDNVGTRKRLSFGTEGKQESADGANKNKLKIQKCSMCDGGTIFSLVATTLRKNLMKDVSSSFEEVGFVIIVCYKVML